MATTGGTICVGEDNAAVCDENMRLQDRHGVASCGDAASLQTLILILMETCRSIDRQNINTNNNDRLWIWYRCVRYLKNQTKC